MIVSEARREANRRNAQRSTGPRTEAGKERSRQNALKHGLSAEVVRHPEDGPTPGEPSSWSQFLVDQVDGIMSRLGRCDRLDARHRERISRRAELSWDDDRRLEVEFLGSGIGRDPAAVARELRMSPQGCDWMAERWALLARAADRDGIWTPEQRSLAFDLLGRPADLRGDDPSESIDPEGRPVPEPLGLAGLARREAAGLHRRKAELAPADAVERAWARLEPDESDDADLRKLRRHEADLHRRLRWCVARLREATPPPPLPIPPPPPAPASPPPAPKSSVANPAVDELNALTDAEFEAIMARIEAGHLGPIPTSAPTLAPSRPDPEAARRKARDAARRDKREHRRG